MRRWRRWVFAALALACGAALAALFTATARSRAARAEALCRIFGGCESIERVISAQMVKATRLGPLPNDADWRDAQPADYPTIGRAVVVPRETAASVARALADPASYGWDYAKSCTPRYAVMLSFYHAAGRVDVLLCFECDVLAIARDGVIVGGEDFDPARPTFVSACRKLFPRDAVVQGLAERRLSR